jgi:hypothetical protein
MHCEADSPGREDIYFQHESRLLEAILAVTAVFLVAVFECHDSNAADGAAGSGAGYSTWT